ncbi:PREDICTED: uncharacterized protein LOC105569765 [Vollenhovia emeryi]|uniref:uncharacterized protein LOC105569765 n=1 Tax=Vollenhovia emeryi TaxID=411798 RepID=UPI0005F3D1B5|nr:PREDICTED: uncharacterized protein LOC105569765 [Vollenhovia emeryi]
MTKTKYTNYGNGPSKIKFHIQHWMDYYKFCVQGCYLIYLNPQVFLGSSASQHELKKLSAQSEFVYFGIAEQLKKCINATLHEKKELYLQFNCDGLPLFKSSSKEFWPLLCKIYFQPDIYEPFPVLVHFGDSKPNSIQEYLEEFVQEISLLLKEGIVIEEQFFQIHVMCFICDKPARSFIKCIKGHGGYNACERCTVKGERYERKTIYLTINCPKRTDESFRKFEDKEHHGAFLSPLLAITPKIDMISHFVLDIMHLCYLGIAKKLLTQCWLGTKSNTKLSPYKIQQLSLRMLHLKPEIPIEFQRSTRSLKDHALESNRIQIFPLIL